MIGNVLETVALFQYKDRLSEYNIPIIKIRRSHGCLYNGKSCTGIYHYIEPASYSLVCTHVDISWCGHLTHLLMPFWIRYMLCDFWSCIHIRGRFVCLIIAF